MERSRYRILAAVRDADGDIEFGGSEAVAAVELERRGLLVRRKPDAFGDDESVFVCKGLTPAGYAALDEREGRVGRWFLKRLDTILTATVTAVVISVATAWVTAHFAAAKEMARWNGDAEGRGGRNADDGQPLAEAHYTNAAPVSAVQQQRAE